MVIGVPKEIKNNEFRVGVTPAGVFELKKHGHSVLVESGAGIGSAIEDEEYLKAGATLVASSDEVWAKSDIICKVKEPIEPEYKKIREGQVLFTYLHLAPDPAQTKALLDAKAIGIAYETVQLADGSLPLLNPMSEVAGRMSVQIGAAFLQKNNGGAGILMGGVPGVEPAKVVIFGAGNVGANAAKIAVGMGADVTLLDINKAKLNHLDEVWGGRVKTLLSNSYTAAEQVARADLLVGAVLVPGAKAPTVVTEDMVKTMKKGSVIVDVAIDQGGCVQTVDHATTHDNPYYVKHGVIHYSVANMPGAVPRTSTYALSGVTLPYLVRIADKGAEHAMLDDPALAKGLNVYKGKVTFKGVADALGYTYVESDELF